MQSFRKLPEKAKLRITPLSVNAPCADLQNDAALLQRLNASEHELKLITDSIPMLVARLDRDIRYRFVNAAYTGWFGLKAEQFIGSTFREVQGETAWEKIRPYIERVMQGEMVEFETELPYCRGGSRLVHARYVPEQNNDNEVIGMIAFSEDVTERRKFERALFQREREFKTLAENSPDVIARVGRDLRHVYVNQAVESMYGIKTDEFIGRRKTEMVFSESISSTYEKAVTDVFDLGRQQAFDFRTGDDVSPRYFTARMIPEFDKAGQVQSVLAITHDVTQSTLAELERNALLVRERSARAEAESATQIRDQFLGVVSHELRTPLNGIQSWAHVLEAQFENPPAPVQRALRGIRIGVEQQVRLIEDLLDMTRALSGKLRLTRQTIVLRSLLEGVLENMAPAIAERQIHLIREIEFEDESIEGDAHRIQQIIRNLLSNAVKFTPYDGSIWFNAKIDGDHACISVRDNGKGIAAELVPQLFDPFRQADSSNTRHAGGMGMGLALVRRLTELHGGHVKAESAGEGQGANFTVFLPLTLSHTHSTIAVGDYPEHDVLRPELLRLNGVRVLLVDDEKEAREALTILLSQTGARIVAAESGIEARAHLAVQERGDRPQILICDIAMPGEDGYHTIKKIREWEQTAGIKPEHQLPAIALTAFTTKEDRFKALAAGFQVHLSKPVLPSDLIAMIGKLVVPDPL